MSETPLPTSATSAPAADISGVAPGPLAVAFPRGARAQAVRFGLALVVSALVVTAVGLFRLTRQFPSAGDSPSLLVPFLEPVLALALEAGALVALSVAHVGALVGLADRGLARRARATAALFAVACAVLWAAQLVPKGTEHPGQFANELIQTAFASCSDDAEVAVPLLGLTVQCREPRRLVGQMPGVRSVRIAMRQLTFSDDLRRVEIRELELEAKRALTVHLRADVAKIAGIAPWSRSTRLSTLERLAVLALLAATLWLSGAVLGRRSTRDIPTPSRRLRLLGVLLAGLPGVLVAAAFIVVDQDQAAPWAFAAAAGAGLAAMTALRFAVRSVPQMFSSFGSF